MATYYEGSYGGPVMTQSAWREPWHQAWQGPQGFGRHEQWGDGSWTPASVRAQYNRYSEWAASHDSTAWPQQRMPAGPARWSPDQYESWAAEKYDTSTSTRAFSPALSLSEEPGDVLLVNSDSSGAYASLCADATDADLVAFDAEWAPDWTYGSDNPVSVLQLAFPTSGRVYVLQLGLLGNRLPPAVQMMLVNPGVTKVGFGANDAPKFKRSGISLTPGSVLDVQSWSAEVMQEPIQPESLSLKKAAHVVLGYRMDKDKRHSCSDWSRDKLSPEQIQYAALDAWVALRLYYAIAG